MISFIKVLYLGWLPYGDMLVTCWLPVGYLLVTCWLPVGYLLVTCWLPVGYLLVTCWLPVGYLLVTCFSVRGITYDFCNINQKIKCVFKRQFFFFCMLIVFFLLAERCILKEGKNKFSLKPKQLEEKYSVVQCNSETIYNITTIEDILQ